MANIDLLRAAATAKAAAASEAATAAAEAVGVAQAATAALEAALAYVEPPPDKFPIKGPGKLGWFGMDANSDDNPFAEMKRFEDWCGLPINMTGCFHGRGYFGPGKQWSGMANSPTIRAGGAIDRILEKGFFVDLAQPLLQKYRLPSNTSYDLLLCAMYYRLFIADRGHDETHTALAQAALGGWYHPAPAEPRPVRRGESPPTAE